jgi:glycogen debranching enzyme
MASSLWGFKLYGFGAEAGHIAHDISIGGSHFLLNQLPELYTAFQRDEMTFPVQYLGANVPQAWAAGSIFMLMQAMLGSAIAGCFSRDEFRDQASRL